MNDIKRKVKDFFGTERFSSSAMTALLIAAVIMFNALLFVLVETFGLVLYRAEKIDYSLTGSTDEMFSDAIAEGKKVTIYFCMSESELENHDTGREVYITAKKFAERYDGFIDINYLNILTRQDKDGNFVDMSKYKTDDIPIYKSSVIFECGESNKVVTDTYTGAGFAPFFTLNSSKYVTAYNGEEVIASMIGWVTSSEHRKAYFTQRHGEMVDVAFTNLLTSAGYEMDVIDLRKNSVPEDADLLIISNPTSDFEASRDGSVYTEIDKLRAFMERGGNIYVSIDPYVKTLSVLEGFIAEYGISLSYSLSSSDKTVRSIVKDMDNAITTDGFTLISEYADSDIARSISKRVKLNGSVIVRECGALELTDDSAKPILISSEASVLEAGGKTVSDGGSYVLAAASEKQTADGKTSRIFVIPTIYLTVSDSLVSDGYSNKDFLFSTFEELFYAENPPYGCKPIMYSSNILQDLTMRQARIYTAIALSVPAVIAITGAVVIIRRKNR